MHHVFVNLSVTLVYFGQVFTAFVSEICAYLLDQLLGG